MSDPEALIALAERVEGSDGSDNRLDVEIEVALFVPERGWIACRANSAGTKVIYTHQDGKEQTFLPPDWTLETARHLTIGILRTRAVDARALRLARQVAAQDAEWSGAQELAALIRDGGGDGVMTVRVAFAAIKASTERAADWLNICPHQCPECRDALRAGGHLQEQADA